MQRGPGRKKNDTKIINFGSVVCFLGHSLRVNVEAQLLPFSRFFKLGLNEWHFGLPQLYAVMHLTLSMTMCIAIERAYVW